jgi:hypothetical protein
MDCQSATGRSSRSVLDCCRALGSRARTNFDGQHCSRTLDRSGRSGMTSTCVCWSLAACALGLQTRRSPTTLAAEMSMVGNRDMVAAPRIGPGAPHSSHDSGSGCTASASGSASALIRSPRIASGPLSRSGTGYVSAVSAATPSSQVDPVQQRPQLGHLGRVLRHPDLGGTTPSWRSVANNRTSPPSVRPPCAIVQSTAVATNCPATDQRRNHRSLVRHRPGQYRQHRDRRHAPQTMPDPLRSDRGSVTNSSTINNCGTTADTTTGAECDTDIGGLLLSTRTKSGNSILVDQEATASYRHTSITTCGTSWDP